MCVALTHGGKQVVGLLVVEDFYRVGGQPEQLLGSNAVLPFEMDVEQVRSAPARALPRCFLPAVVAAGGALVLGPGQVPEVGGAQAQLAEGKF